MFMHRVFACSRWIAAAAGAVIVSGAAVPGPMASELSENVRVRERMQWAELFLLRQGVAVPKLDAVSAARLQPVLDAWVNQGRSEAVAAPQQDWIPGSVSDLLPTQVQRWGQLWKWEVKFDDRPDRLFISDGSDEASGLKVVDNPARYLTKLTLSINPGGLFASPADLEAAYSNLGKYASLGVRFSLENEALQRGEPLDKLDYLRRTRKLDWIGRLFSAVNVSLALGERSKLDGALLMPGDDEYVETFNVKFDPSKLLPGPSDLKTAYASLKAYADNYRYFTADGGKPPTHMKLVETTPCPGIGGDDDSKPSLDCFKRLQKDSGWIKALRIVLPTVEFGSVDEFDFVRAGNHFLPLPANREKSLETLSLSWDLKSIFDVMKRKTDALAIAKIHGEILKKQSRFNQGPPSIDPVPPKPPVVGRFYYHHLEPKQALSGLSWVLLGPDGKPTANPTAFAGVRLEADGSLIGYPTATGKFEFTVRLSDQFGRHDQRRFVVSVQDPGLLALRREVADMILALAESPQLIADDAWEAFQAKCRVLEDRAADGRKATSSGRAGPR